MDGASKWALDKAAAFTDGPLLDKVDYITCLALLLDDARRAALLEAAEVAEAHRAAYAERAQRNKNNLGVDFRRVERDAARRVRDELRRLAEEPSGD